MGHRRQRPFHRQCRPPVPLRSTYGQHWRWRPQCTNSPRGPLGGGRSKAYGVYVKKVPLEGGDYTVDHTAAIYLMDRHGHFVTTIDYHENDKVALEKLKRIVA
ncbi:SCO family protein [Sphingopyxis sp.]|uniref:SCO family protein n=1 Tax=Sphingopyxis sp. TaxID=1908224 RepID=UPI004036260E